MGFAVCALFFNDTCIFPRPFAVEQIGYAAGQGTVAYFSIAAAVMAFGLIVYFLVKATGKVKEIKEELRMRNEYFKVTLNSFGEGLITTDLKGRILFMNTSAGLFTGWKWKEAKEQPLHNVFDIINERTGKPAEHIVTSILKNKKKIEWQKNIVLKARNAGTFIISNQGLPIIDAVGNVAGAVLLFKDIRGNMTERKKEEEELIKSNEVFDKTKRYICEAIDEVRKLSHQLPPNFIVDNSLRENVETLLLSINLDNRFDIHFHCDDTSNAYLKRDIQITLLRILQEQVKNILLHSEARSIDIALTQLPNAVRLRIYDDGKGFDAKTGKTGIGLGNIKKRTESLSGKFALNTKPGCGCEIITEIPYTP